jgi:hypothetical protein
MKSDSKKYYWSRSGAKVPNIKKTKVFFSQTALVLRIPYVTWIQILLIQVTTTHIHGIESGYNIYLVLCNARHVC